MTASVRRKWDINKLIYLKDIDAKEVIKKWRNNDVQDDDDDDDEEEEDIEQDDQDFLLKKFKMIKKI